MKALIKSVLAAFCKQSNIEVLFHRWLLLAGLGWFQYSFRYLLGVTEPFSF